MKHTLTLVLLFAVAGILPSHAQFSRYIIKLKDKGSNPFSISNPGQYLSQRALDRRARYNIAIDSADLPVTPRYIDSIRLAGDVTILNTSKWLNQVAIQTTDAAALVKINSFPFVSVSSPVGARILPGTVQPVNKKTDSVSVNPIPLATARPAQVNDYYSYGLSNGQVKIHHGDFLHNHGFRGEGMQLCVLDAGFYHYLSLPTFDSIRNNGQLLGTWDFVTNNASVDEDNSHGMQCLSTIAANIPGVFVGTAPKTSFYLFRTEDVASEYPIEEQNLAAGAERADSLGVDLCSVSLGYSQFSNSIFDYTYADMNGNTSISARAADMAAQKGMLMVVAAGNEGNNSWHYLITPSDADSVLCVGAVDTTGVAAGFSSYGPSSDGRVKPAVAAVGSFAVVANTGNGMPSFGFGTSFACPNMAGITTCLWQAFPEMNNITIMDALERSAQDFATPDNRIGYGIPDAKKAFTILQKKLYTQQLTAGDCVTHMQLAAKTDNSMSIIVERKTNINPVYTVATTLQQNSDWGVHQFNYNDDLTGFSGSSVTYRFKMVIGTDTTYYLDSSTINLQHPCTVPVTENNIAIGPNPAGNELNVIVSRLTDARLTILLQNELGQRMYKKEWNQSAGTYTQTVPMKQMAKGVYVVTVYVDNKKEITRKIIHR